MTIGDVLKSISDRLHSTAHVKTIYGDPIVAEGKTIIPVAEVKYGFGGGGGQQREMSDQESNTDGDSAETTNRGEARAGMGGGGGISVRPLGVVEVSANGTHYISFAEGRKIALSLLAGLLMGMMVAGRRRRG